MSDLPDASQRTKALDVNHSWAVSAPAGSGKTQLLTHRVLKLLAIVNSPEEILAITFTRKAAAEMHARILNTLTDAALKQPEQDQLSRELALSVLKRDQLLKWSLIDNPSRLKIQTIDSFCMHLVSRMPLASRMGVSISIADDPSNLYITAIRGFISRSHESPVKDSWAVLLSQLDNQVSRIELLITKLLANREQWLPWLIGHGKNPNYLKLQLEQNLISVIEESLQDASIALAPWSSQLVYLLNYAAEQSAIVNPESSIVLLKNISQLPQASVKDLSLWQSLLEIFLTKSGKWRKRLTKNEGFPSKHNEASLITNDTAGAIKAQALELITSMAATDEVLNKLQQISCLPSAKYNESQWQMLQALMQILPHIVAELALTFRDHGQVDYVQISIAARDSLEFCAQTTNLALKLDYQINHILVDEFQDTSTAQFDLLQKLTEGWQYNDGRSFFIVGDGMQSCYGFRNANVGLFLAAQQFGVGNAAMEPLKLKTNFRSCSGLIDWINSTFSKSFPIESDISRGAVKYNESCAIKNDISGQRVNIYICKNDHKRTQEAFKVIEAVKAIQLQNSEDSIAILIRNRSHLKIIIQSLKQANIGWKSVDIDPLSEKPAVTDLLSLLHALLDLTNKLAWLAILRAPWCGLTLADLLIIAGDNESKDCSIWNKINKIQIIERLSDDGRSRISNFKLILKKAIYNRARQPLREWLESTWLQLKGPITLTSTDEYLETQSFLYLLEQHQVGGQIKNKDDFLNALNRLYAPLTSTNNYNLQIMTIHKAKGLEFDHVIIPGLDRKPAGNDQEMLIWHERVDKQGDTQLILAPMSARSDQQNQIYQYVKKEKSIKENLEALRLIYVAVTRAIKSLTLIGCLKQDTQSLKLAVPMVGSLLHPIWNAIQSQSVFIESIEPIQTNINQEQSQLYRLLRSHIM